MQEFKYSDLIKPTQSWTFRGKEELLTDNKTFLPQKRNKQKTSKFYIFSLCEWMGVGFI